jgi:hypothetical protein
MFTHTIEDLYTWAVPQIHLLKTSEWKKSNTPRLESLYPGFLFYFLDGTVLQIWSPEDVVKNKQSFNKKHGFCALTYYIVVAPDGMIVYVSLVDVGCAHDATTWNTSPDFPPVSIVDGEERKDGRTLLQGLEEFYGPGKQDGEEEGEEEGVGQRTYVGADLDEKMVFCLGGDKAYPYILLPNGWKLFVTMTSGEVISHQEAEEATEATREIFGNRSQMVPEFVHHINDDPRRKRCPLIAKSRSVVERVIGAMKEYKILENVPYISRQQINHVYMLVVVIAGLCNYNLKVRGTVW